MYFINSNREKIWRFGQFSFQTFNMSLAATFVVIFVALRGIEGKLLLLFGI